jgi:hypothetical protein
MGILADETTEEKLIRALKFVKVQVDNSGPNRSGYLTDISIAMLLIEMKRNGLVVTNGTCGCGNTESASD